MGIARNIARLIPNGSGELPTANIAAGAIVEADIANLAVSAGKLASALDLTGKTVTLPSGVGGKVLGMSSVTLDTAPQNYSGLNNFGSGTIYYIDAAKRSASYTKQSASSTLLVFFNYSYRANGSGNGLHSMVVYTDTSPTTNNRVMLFDIQRVANACAGGSAYSGAAPFTGLGTGTYTFHVVPCRRDSGTMSHGINGYVSSDQSDGVTWVYVMEVGT